MPKTSDTENQQRGHCQCCLREQAVINGHMAKHGYTVEDHWFKGGCSEYNAPLEHDRSVADRIILEIRTEIEADLALYDDLKSGKKVPQWVTRNVFPFREKEQVHYADAMPHEQRAALDTAIFRAQQDARHGEILIQSIEDAIKLYFGKPLLEVRKNPPPERIMDGEKRVSERRGVLHVKRVDGGRVYWEDERGFGSKMSTREWRTLPKAPEDTASCAADDAAIVPTKRRPNVR